MMQYEFCKFFSKAMLKRNVLITCTWARSVLSMLIPYQIYAKYRGQRVNNTWEIDFLLIRFVKITTINVESIQETVIN